MVVTKAAEGGWRRGRDRCDHRRRASPSRVGRHEADLSRLTRVPWLCLFCGRVQPVYHSSFNGVEVDTIAGYPLLPIRVRTVTTTATLPLVVPATVAVATGASPLAVSMARAVCRCPPTLP